MQHPPYSETGQADDEEGTYGAVVLYRLVHLGHEPRPVPVFVVRCGRVS